MSKQAELDEILELVVNRSYRAGKNNDHPNNANLHRVVDEAKQAVLDWHNKHMLQARLDELNDVPFEADSPAALHYVERVAELEQEL